MNKNEVLLRIQSIIEDYHNSDFPDWICCVDDIENVVKKELKG